LSLATADIIELYNLSALYIQSKLLLQGPAHKYLWIWKIPV